MHLGVDRTVLAVLASHAARNRGPSPASSCTQGILLAEPGKETGNSRPSGASRFTPPVPSVERLEACQMPARCWDLRHTSSFKSPDSLAPRAAAGIEAAASMSGLPRVPTGARTVQGLRRVATVPESDAHVVRQVLGPGYQLVPVAKVFRAPATPARPNRQDVQRNRQTDACHLVL
jgi:hypothetical protein